MQLRFGIREKLLLPLLLGLAVIIFVLLFIWQPNQLEKAKQDFIQDQTNILKTLTPSIIQNMLANDLSELHSVFENSQLIHKNEWRYIQLTNPDNEQLYPIFSSKPKSTNTEVKIKITIEENDEIFGYITLYSDWESAKNKELENIYQLSIFSVFLFSIIAIFSFILQTSWIYTPITKLKNITSQISKGNYTITFPTINSNDEIGELNHAFKLMHENIKAYQSNLQQMFNVLENEEKRLRAILDTAPDAIITLNKFGIIQSFNHGAENIFGYDANEIIGESIKTLMPEDIANSHDHYMSEFKNTDHSIIIGKNSELYGIKKNGDKFPIDLSINAKEIDGELLFTGVIRDITERNKVDRLKSEFVATVSHELRTPLTAIKGSLDLVTKGFNLKLPEQASTMLDVANRNVERLLTLINDILDVSKLESGEINFVIEKIEIKPFIENITEINQEYAKKYSTTFKYINCDNEVSVNADRDRLEQVMSNLLSNAAKYSPENVPVEIFTVVNNGIIRVNVKDYGPGIPEDFQDTLFEKFTQADSGDTRQVGGTGLGLSISKMIIEKLGGKLGFETIINKETTFYFELPINKEK